MPFADPPPFAAFEHRDAAVGFEVAFFRTTPDGVVVDGRVRFDYASPRFDTRCLLEYDRRGVVLAYPGIAVRRA